MSQNPKVLFVGASGAVARKVLPILSESFTIVGVSRVRDEGKSYCSDFYQGDLLRDHEALFARIFHEHHFDGIVWNAVRYFPGLLHTATRPTLHTEFDLAIALPLACLQAALRGGFGEGSPFVLVASQLAFGRKANWGSYSIAKSGQVMLANYLADELSPQVIPRVVAPGAVPTIPDAILARAFLEALAKEGKGRGLYIVDENGVR